MEKIYSTNYSVATKWLNNNLVMCNNICEFDESVVENCEFRFYDEESEEYTEIYQWYITDCSKFDKDFLSQHFGLLFSYSDLLDCYILCVPHYGTSWDYVEVETDLGCAERKLGESKS